MFNATSALLWALGALGATIAAISTFVTWYVHDVTLAAGGAVHLLAVPTGLWDYTTLTPIMIVVGAGWSPSYAWPSSTRAGPA